MADWEDWRDAAHEAPPPPDVTPSPVASDEAAKSARRKTWKSPIVAKKVRNLTRGFSSRRL